MKVKFISTKDGGESQLLHLKSDNKEFMIENDTDEIIEELSDSLLHRYQIGLEQSMKGSNFLFGYADRLFLKCHFVSLNCAG